MLDDVALHFRDGDLEHHLVAAVDSDEVNDLTATATATCAATASASSGSTTCIRAATARAAAARSAAAPDQARRQVVSELRFDRARDIAVKHDTVGEALDLDVGMGQSASDCGTNTVEIACDRDVEAADLSAFGVKEEDVGLSDLDADDIGAPRGSDHRVGNGWVCHQHVPDVARQVDDDRFSYAERHEPRRRIAAGEIDQRNVPVCRRDLPDSDQKRSRDRGDKERATDQDRFCHWIAHCPFAEALRSVQVPNCTTTPVLLLQYPRPQSPPDA